MKKFKYKAKLKGKKQKGEIDAETMATKICVKYTLALISCFVFARQNMCFS